VIVNNTVVVTIMTRWIVATRRAGVLFSMSSQSSSPGECGRGGHDQPEPHRGVRHLRRLRASFPATSAATPSV
jgi:hypothetical protein